MLNEIAEKYFHTLNPIAERISSDILAIQNAYEGLWNCLGVKEKNQIINETVVHPEAVLKYTLGTKSTTGVSLDIPLITQPETGRKYVVDENTGLSWRDEHSAPFSWKTLSQIDLSIFNSPNYDTSIKENSYFLNNESKAHEYFNTATIIGTLNNVSDKESFVNKKSEKQDNKRSNLAFQSQNVMLVGTCSKLSGFCSKLKLFPGKSYSYEVQTVATNQSVSNDNFFDKIKTTAVFKIQNTLKLVGGKNSTDKKSSEVKETENLVKSKEQPTIVKLQKPSPKIAKPKFPPPPPPIVNLKTSKPEEKEDCKSSKNLIFLKNPKPEKQHSDEKDSEKVTLLEGDSVQSFLSADPDSLEQDLQAKITQDLSDDLNSISTEYTPLSGPSVDIIIPKSGFDFLDNW